MKIYISIPISGRDPALQKAKARAYETSLRKLGHDPVNPFDTPPPPPGLNSSEEYAYYLWADLDRLSECDAIYLTNGWRSSRGCCIEHLAARSADLQVFTDVKHIPSSCDCP